MALRKTLPEALLLYKEDFYDYIHQILKGKDVVEDGSCDFEILSAFILVSVLEKRKSMIEDLKFKSKHN